jgi:hypothetical protein
VQCAHAAGDVETDTAGRDDPACVGVECGHAADRKAVAPMGIRHRIGGAEDARQGGDVGGLLQHLLVHVANQGLGRVEHHGHPHRTLRRDAPLRVADLDETLGEIAGEPGHGETSAARFDWPFRDPQTSTTQRALHSPVASRVTDSAV